MSEEARPGGAFALPPLFGEQVGRLLRVFTCAEPARRISQVSNLSLRLRLHGRMGGVLGIPPRLSLALCKCKCPEQCQRYACRLQAQCHHLHCQVPSAGLPVLMVQEPLGMRPQVQRGELHQ